jgi:NADH dehydrogenase
MKRVIIVGAGFAGLNAAKILARRKDLEILIIDRRNHHLFQPLLYQVAMAGLSPADISVPIRSLFRKRPNVRTLLAEVTGVERARRAVRTTAGTFEYDYLILGCGAEHSYFGKPQWEDFAPGLKTLEQATEIRRRVLVAFERAETAPETEQAPWLTFVVVGAGPTGVELAGALGEIRRYTLAKDFRKIDPTRTRVLLVEAGPRVLAQFPEDLAAHARRDLADLGVDVMTGAPVTDMDGDGVTVGGKRLPAKTIIWAAGVKPSPLNAMLAAPLDRQGRVHITENLCLADDPNVFVLGDQAHLDDKTGQPLPGLAPVAMQQGRHAARQIVADLAQKSRAPFKYVDKGSMATIGRKRAIAMVGKLHMTGLVAWAAWLVIHVYFLIGFKNRFFVLYNWLYSYLTYRRGARLITERGWHLPTMEPEDSQRRPAFDH